MYFLSSRHWPIPGVFLRVRTFSNDVKHWTVSLRQRSFFDDNDEVCCWSSGFVTMFVSLFATLHETCKIHGGNDSEIMTLNLPGGSTLHSCSEAHYMYYPCVNLRTLTYRISLCLHCRSHRVIYGLELVGCWMYGFTLNQCVNITLV